MIDILTGRANHLHNARILAVINEIKGEIYYYDFFVLRKKKKITYNKL